MSAEYFAPFDTVRYEGPDSANDLAYRWYDKDRQVLGKRMEDHLRVAVCFWHTFCWPGSDVFGAGTFTRPWHAGANDAVAAKAKREAALAFVEKLDVPFYCFHDVDVMADADDVASFRRSFAEAVDHLEVLQAQHGRKLLWGTANLFSHPRYMAGVLFLFPILFLVILWNSRFFTNPGRRNLYVAITVDNTPLNNRQRVFSALAALNAGPGDFAVPGGFIQLATVSGLAGTAVDCLPPAAACSLPAHRGRMKVNADRGSLYVCAATVPSVARRFFDGCC